MGSALRLCAESTLYEDWEFQTLMAFDRAAVLEAAQGWPNLDLTDRDALTLLVNVLGNMRGYPHSRTQIGLMTSKGLSDTTLDDLLKKIREAYARRNEGEE